MSGTPRSSQIENGTSPGAGGLPGRRRAARVRGGAGRDMSWLFQLHDAHVVAWPAALDTRVIGDVSDMTHTTALDITIRKAAR